MSTIHPRELPEVVASNVARLDELEAFLLADDEKGDDADTPPTADELERANSRDELDELARKAGITEPDKLANKGEVAKAIVEARK